jgi:hypothetical protein
MAAVHQEQTFAGRIAAMSAIDPQRSLAAI